MWFVVQNNLVVHMWFVVQMVDVEFSYRRNATLVQRVIPLHTESLQNYVARWVKCGYIKRCDVPYKLTSKMKHSEIKVQRKCPSYLCQCCRFVNECNLWSSNRASAQESVFVLLPFCSQRLKVADVVHRTFTRISFLNAVQMIRWRVIHAEMVSDDDCALLQK